MALCKELGVLPVAGGLLDQNPVVVMLMQDLISAINEKQELEQKRQQSKMKR